MLGVSGVLQKPVMSSVMLHLCNSFLLSINFEPFGQPLLLPLGFSSQAIVALCFSLATSLLLRLWWRRKKNAAFQCQYWNSLLKYSPVSSLYCSDFKAFFMGAGRLMEFIPSQWYQKEYLSFSWTGAYFYETYHCWATSMCWQKSSVQQWRQKKLPVFSLLNF